MDKLEQDIYDGLKMFDEKIQSIAKSKTSWTMAEMGCMMDMLKDMSEVHKNMAKAHHLYSEHSIERY